MSVARYGHTATLLSDGRVLVAGGFHAATRLKNGKVLVIGGGLLAKPDVYDTPQLNTAEEYDPVTGTWGSRTFMSTGRSIHTATPLNDGRVLVAGGVVGVILFEVCSEFTCYLDWYPSSVTTGAEVYIPAL